MTDRQVPLAAQVEAGILAMAAWKKLNAIQSLYAAAILEGDAERALELRDEAHDLLNQCLDLNGEAARATIATFHLNL